MVSFFIFFLFLEISSDVVAMTNLILLVTQYKRETTLS